MDKSGLTMAQRIAEVAGAAEQERTGHRPTAVTVVLAGDTLVITLHGTLSPAELELARSPAGAAQVQEFHRTLFNNSAAGLREEIQKVTGVAVKEAAAMVEPGTGTLVHVFTSGTTVQIFLLTRDIPADTWSGGAENVPRGVPPPSSGRRQTQGVPDLYGGDQADDKHGGEG